MLRLHRFLQIQPPLVAGRVFNIFSRLSTTSAMTAHWTPNSYPKARRSDHVDTYKSATKGAVRVHDPYNWLEKHSEETDRWTCEQELFTRAYLDQNPDRKRLEEAFRASVDYAKVDPTTTLSAYRRFICISSSVLRPYKTITVGTGHTTAGCSTSMVRLQYGLQVHTSS